MMQWLVIVLLLAPQVQGHAFLSLPPSRAFLGHWLNNACNVKQDIGHRESYCGGLHVQTTNGGKCGICGDPWHLQDRPHEVPGKFAAGIITGTYKPGQVIDVIVDITSNHMGYLAFALCPNNNLQKDPDQSCFMENILRMEDGSKYYKIHANKTRAEVKVKLPDGLTCWQCIFQWTYVAGNNWGMGRENIEFWTEDCDKETQGRIGCGRQETFRSCADICIGDGCPTAMCQVAKPPTNASTPTGSTQAPPISYYDQICTEAHIRLEYFSSVGQSYCEKTCVGQKLQFCNLFLCACSTYKDINTSVIHRFAP